MRISFLSGLLVLGASLVEGDRTVTRPDGVTVTDHFSHPLDFTRKVTSQAELQLDSNRHLGKNYLLYLDTPSCPQLTEVVWNMRFNEGREALQLSHTSQFARDLLGAEYIDLVTKQAAASAEGAPCAAVCLDMGAPADMISHPLDHKVFKATSYNHNALSTNAVEDEDAYQTELEFAHFVSAECQGVEVGFINWSNRTATIYWVNQHNELAPVGRLEGQVRVSCRVLSCRRGS